MGKQEVEKLKTRMKAVEEALGLGSNAGKNINLLLDSIRVQGEQASQLNQQNMQLQGMIEMQMRFMKADAEVSKKYEAFMQAEQAKAITEQAAKQEAMKHPIPLEFKNKPPEIPGRPQKKEEEPGKCPDGKCGLAPPGPMDKSVEKKQPDSPPPEPKSKIADKGGKIDRE